MFQVLYLRISGQDGLKLPALVGGGHGGDDPAVITAQAGGFGVGIILAEGHKEDVLAHQEPADVLRRGAQAVVGGYADHHRLAVA